MRWFGRTRRPVTAKFVIICVGHWEFAFNNAETLAEVAEDMVGRLGEA